jgi:hypothetical protein
MSKKNSFELINYSLRLNKQVERKIILDIFSRINNEIDLSNYAYIGMGSIYYYDFIMIHRAFGLKNLISIDNKDTVKRFEFNKPYDFITFKNKLSSDYLMEHEWKTPSIIWLDYDSKFIDLAKEFIITDLKILGKYAQKNNFLLLTVNAQCPKEITDKKRFLEENIDFISKEYNDLKYLSINKFPYLLQHIMINILQASGEYNKFKFHKTCSFIYQDGALMYTLGGVFNDDLDQVNRILTKHEFLNNNLDEIQDIEIPHLTNREKFYLDSNVLNINNSIQEFIDNLKNIEGITNSAEIKMRTNVFTKQNFEFELTLTDLENYTKNYRFIPSYFEGFV